jgi:diguanylate cyclase (GGDEF)-like protein/PAS domain S-box-containing protein
MGDETLRRRARALWEGVERGVDERSAMAGTLFALFAAGSVMGLLAIPLSSYLSTSQRIAEAIACAVGLTACGVIALGWRKLPRWAFPPLLALGTVIVSVGTELASARPTTTEMFYFWVALYAAYFFTRIQTAVQVAFVGLCYAVVLVLGTHGGNEGSRWMITMGTVVIAALLFGRLKSLLDRRLAEKERSERELAASLSLQQATLESTADGILVVDRAGKMVGHNHRFQEMWHLPDEVLAAGHDDDAIVFVLDQLQEPEQFVRKIQELYNRPDAESYDMLRFKDGRVFERYSRPQRGEDGQAHGRVWSFRDVTERERIQTRLQELADRDPLTGLLNRRRFEEELASRVAYARRYGLTVAVLMLDLDNFKFINDTLGHRTGDAVLRSVTEILKARLRATDVLARLGGDEFAVLLPNANTEQARAVAADLLETLRSHRSMFGGKRLRLTTSIGIAVLAEAEPELTAEDLLVGADVAVYEAKEVGRDRCCVYVPSRDRTRSPVAGAGWSERIRKALDEGGFALHAQPIVDLRTNETRQYELLARMLGPDGELLPPSAFLPTAERSGMVIELDTWVTRFAIQLLDRHGDDSRDLRLEINLSARSLGNPQLMEAITQELETSKVDPANLIFEVTETAAVMNMAEAREFAAALAELGCQFALDDFGAGFASFYYLKYLPVEFLKIDGDFITNLHQNTTDQAVVRAIVDLSHSLGKSTIAEFVTDERTIDLLTEYGVDYAQGYQIGRPRPVEQIWTGVGADELLQPLGSNR